MFDRFKSEGDRRRFEKTWAQAAEELNQKLLIEGFETQKAALRLVHHVAVVGEIRSAEWSQYRDFWDAMLKQIDDALGPEARPQSESLSGDTLEQVSGVFLADSSDQEYLTWSDQPHRGGFETWPPIAQVSRLLLYGDVSFDVSLAGSSVVFAFGQIPLLEELLAQCDEYWVETVIGVNMTGSPRGLMSGQQHHSRMRIAPGGWTPTNLSTRMKLSGVKPWMEGPNRALLDEFYDIREDADSITFEAWDEERVPGPAEWVKLDRYENAPPEVRERYTRQPFRWPSPPRVMSVPQGRPEDNLPDKVIQLPLGFDVEFGPNISETFDVSLICVGPLLRIQDRVESWAEYVMSLDPPEVAFIGNGKWIDTGEDGIWIWRFTCDLGGFGSGAVDWLQRLFEQIHDAHYIERVVIGG